jgi:hypothetical protein
MTGGLMQLVGRGAQDQLVTGNPSFTHFRSVYKRHTEFAMEHFELYFKTTNLNLPQSGSLTLRTKVERYAQLLHDCYLNINLPDIYSPVVPVTQPVPRINPTANAIGYEFQWIKNIGYNMINYVSILVNGQEIVRHTGEWMKLYAALKFDGNKKAIVDDMVGNVPQIYDPANAFDRMNQYPHAISLSDSNLADPSISGRTLTIPLHFWFCESVGAALPLIALQLSEVEIVVELKNIYQLFTVLDTRVSSPTFGTRIAPDSSNSMFTIPHFLSPPLKSDPTVPLNPNLITWKLNPFIQANYIFLSDPELIHIAKTDHSFKITQIDVKGTHGQHGASNDLELTMKNLCTRVVWVSQRLDREEVNDYDNYTNWADPQKPPIDSSSLQFMTPWYSSGNAQPTNIRQRDILLESSLILDGKERFSTKSTDFFSKLQNYRHHTGRSSTVLPGVYAYSFALDHETEQPSGHINGSMFNKTILRNTYVEPPLSAAPASSGTVVCVLRSTAGNPNPTVVNPNAMGANGKKLYSPDELVTVIRKTDAQTLQYTYNVRAYVESYNFLRVLGGIANVVFSS